MIRRTFEMLYLSRAASYELSGPPEAAVTALSAGVRSRWSFGVQETLVGSVSPDRVSLRRRRPFQQNSFRSHFTGRFEFDGRKTRLIGQYGTSLYTRAFMTLWFGFILLWVLATLIIVVTSVRKDPKVLFFPFVGALMFLFGIGLVRFGVEMGAKDERFIDDRIRDLLDAKGVREIDAG